MCASLVHRPFSTNNNKDDSKPFQTLQSLQSPDKSLSNNSFIPLYLSDFFPFLPSPATRKSRLISRIHPLSVRQRLLLCSVPLAASSSDPSQKDGRAGGQPLLPLSVSVCVFLHHTITDLIFYSLSNYDSFPSLLSFPALGVKGGGDLIYLFCNERQNRRHLISSSTTPHPPSPPFAPPGHPCQLNDFCPIR